MSAPDPSPVTAAVIGPVRGRPSPAELVALVVALDTVDDAGAPAPVRGARRSGNWNDPAAGMRPASWATDLSPRRYGRPKPGGN